MYTTPSETPEISDFEKMLGMAFLKELGITPEELDKEMQEQNAMEAIMVLVREETLSARTVFEEALRVSCKNHSLELVDMVIQIITSKVQEVQTKE